GLDHQAVHRGHRAGLPACRAVHVLARPVRHDPAWRHARCRGQLHLGRSPARPDRAGPRGLPHGDDHRLDVCRHRQPDRGGGVRPDAGSSCTWGDRLRGLIELGPVVFLMAMIIGSMYAGIASPTEAAAVGVLGSLIVAGMQSTLTWPNLREAFMAATRTSAMIGLIIMAAVFM